MTLEARAVTLPDGRTLDVFVGGAASGGALIAHHGTPGDASRFAAWNDDEILDDLLTAARA